MGRVCVVALSDVGRSPRMLYHSLALANQGFDVDIIAQKGSKPLEAVTQHRRIALHLLSVIVFPSILRLLFLPLKLALLCLQLFWALVISIRKPDIILVQTPPALPTLPVVWLVARLRGSRLIIDWHNLGFTLLALSLEHRSGGPGSLTARHPFVQLYRATEQVFGRLADQHICVTRALKGYLQGEGWRFEPQRVSVLHDRPPALFRPLEPDARANFLKALAAEQRQEQPLLADRLLALASSSTDSRLVISSTSWSLDEDFSLLLDAVRRLEEHARATSSFPSLVFVITGRGTMRDAYMAQVAAMQLTHMSVFSVWLKAEQYPLLLGSADLGVSLHQSSSQLDLPMKVLDMFGCGLPVCALNFKCLDELVIHEKNGLVFSNSLELYEHLKELFSPSTSKVPGRSLATMRAWVLSSLKANRWDDVWPQVALPLFRESNSRNRPTRKRD